MSKYLIIEDEDGKAEEIKSELLKLGIHHLSITHVKSLKSGLECVKTTKFNLVVLDLNIPARDNENPIENGGATFLEKLVRVNDKFIKPDQIIGLTSFPNLIDIYEDRFSELDFSLKDFASTSWRTTLRNRVVWNVDSANKKERVPGKKIIISIHGIRTLGKWQNNFEIDVANKLPEFLIKTYRYNYFSTVQLLIPFARNRIVNHFKEELINIINENPNSEFHFISHSFGTYVLAKGLKNLPIDTEMKIDNIILASSVLKENFQWTSLKKKFNINNIINECGYNDNALLLSKIACLGMGMAGRRGFMGCDVTNRFYHGGHDFFNRQADFMGTYWLPIFKKEIVNHDERNFGKIRENFEIFISTRMNFFLISLLLISIVLY